MSFGFSEEVPSIGRAITEAVHHKNGRLPFFAAASNSGGNVGEVVGLQSRTARRQ
jgi:hypothetical protein